MEIVPLTWARVPGLRGVMSRRVWVVGDMCMGLGVVGVRVVVVVVVSGEGSFWTIMSMVAPVLSSRVRIVRVGRSWRAIISPMREMKRIGWLL